MQFKNQKETLAKEKSANVQLNIDNGISETIKRQYKKNGTKKWIVLGYEVQLFVVKQSP